ncbi:tauropine dehydrogenase-like isoform X2 [Actinia tenebrosa]|uniref:Tauropine dehydrogenase-like isoform X2 n=1 Tax=Actinia tenebrosa TaxID=6105 RepID=A0A6P8ID20_ACTTE|nr:tauropine dehydrogenase-like isoform X2 [Actinia tenebrosa]
MTSSQPTKLVICGGGNGAHAWAGIASSQPDTDVCVLTLFQDEAERWSNFLKEHDFTVNLYSKGECYKKLKTKPRLVTKKPEEVVPGCDVIVFVLPSFVHEQYLEAIKPYIEPGTIIVGLPGRSGLEFQIRGILGDVGGKCTIMNFESLPWATRITEFGKSCEVLGTKATLQGSQRIGSVPPKKVPQATLQKLLGESPALQIKGDLLGLTLVSGGYLHPCILYDRWADWDGKPVDKQPLFYQGISEKAAIWLSTLSDEVVSIGKEIAKQSPGTDMSNVGHLFDWFKRCYVDEVEDMSSLYRAITTNKAYAGLTHPMLQVEEGKWVPNFNYRYMAEDLPYVLIVIRGIAEVVGVETPNIDKLILWAQKIMNKEYLVDGKIQGKDVKETRAPQKYGFTTLKELLGQ